MNNKQRAFLNRGVSVFNGCVIGLSLSMILLGYWIFLWPLFVGGVVHHFQKLGKSE
jgi:hypothetical protein